MTNAALLKKVEELSARVAALEADNTRLREENARLQQENRLLRQKLDQYIRHYFGGQRNEGLDRHQLELLLQGLVNVVTLPTPEPKPLIASRNGTPHPVRRMLAEDKLETHEIVIEPEEVQAQPEGWKKISEERTSQLDWVAAKIVKRVFIRPRYVKAEQFAIAPLPPQPIEQGMAGPGLLAQILVSKYAHHLPLYRQEQMFRQQFGVDLSRKTMGSWVEQAAELLKPVYRVIREDLLRGSYLQADETPIRYLDPDVKGKSQQGYLWTYSRPGGNVLFEWRVSRSREGPEEFLKTFRGKLQTDGYSAYESLAKERADLTLIGCWAHARRGFHDALRESKLAAWFVRQIGLLYAVEKQLREKDAGPQLRAAIRTWQSRPILARLRRAMELVRRRTLPQGLLGQAIDYALKRWEALTRFVDDGVLEIDSNLIENAIRPSALGKKNWLFIGHPTAGERSAVIYTLLGSCRRYDLNPFDYLQDLFTRLFGSPDFTFRRKRLAVFVDGVVIRGPGILARGFALVVLIPAAWFFSLLVYQLSPVGTDRSKAETQELLTESVSIFKFNGAQSEIRRLLRTSSSFRYFGCARYLDGGSMGFIFTNQEAKAFLVFVPNPNNAEGIGLENGRKYQKILLVPQMEFSPDDPPLELRMGSRAEVKVMRLVRSSLRESLPVERREEIFLLLEILAERTFDWESFQKATLESGLPRAKGRTANQEIHTR